MIVISGITSSLGISLARLLVKKGIRVRGFARRIEKVKELLKHPLIELQTADLRDEVLMRSICSEAKGIIHLAALSAPWGNYDDFVQTNVIGTQSIVRMAHKLNVNRFVYVSTPSIYFDYTDRFNISEDEELPPRSVNAYASTKKRAEEIVDRAFLEGLPCITLRPRAIFGPHDQALFPRLLKVCQNRGIPRFKKSSPLVDITYVDNVAHALWLALEAPDHCLGHKYNITNGEPFLLWDILGVLLNKLSIPMKTRQVPYPLAYSIAWMSELLSQVTRKEPYLTRYAVGVLTYSQTLSIEKARRELNYQPLISLNEGINRYVDWFQAQ